MRFHSDHLLGSEAIPLLASAYVPCCSRRLPKPMKSKGFGRRWLLCLLLMLAQTSQQPGRSVLVQDLWALSSEPKRILMHVTASAQPREQSSKVAHKCRDPRLHDRGGQEMQPRLACCGVCPPATLADGKVARPVEICFILSARSARVQELVGPDSGGWQTLGSIPQPDQLHCESDGSRPGGASVPSALG